MPGEGFEPPITSLCLAFCRSLLFALPFPLFGFLLRLTCQCRPNYSNCTERIALHHAESHMNQQGTLRQCRCTSPPRLNILRCSYNYKRRGQTLCPRNPPKLTCAHGFCSDQLGRPEPHMFFLSAVMRLPYLHSAAYATVLTNRVGWGFLHSSTSAGSMATSTISSVTIGCTSGSTVKLAVPTRPPGHLGDMNQQRGV